MNMFYKLRYPPLVHSIQIEQKLELMDFFVINREALGLFMFWVNYQHFLKMEVYSIQPG